MTVQEAIWTRRSCRKYKDTPIDEAIIQEMMEAARRVPTPGNSQSHVFGVVRDRELRARLAEAAGGQRWIATAPVVFALCGRIDWDLKDLPEDDYGLIVNYRRFGRPMVKYLNDYPDRRMCSTLLANGGGSMQGVHISLIAAAHGMQACFIGDLDLAKANEVLGLPDYLTCLFLLPVGYPDEAPGEKALKPLGEIAFCDRWDEKNG